MFLHGCFLPALGAEGLVPISGTTGQEGKPCSSSQKEPSSAQTEFSPGALRLLLLTLLPLPAEQDLSAPRETSQPVVSNPL